MIVENLQNIENRIQEACTRAGRKRDEVTLIAVSKTKPVEMLQEVYKEGIRDFGENKVQELCQKIEVLPENINWHMIGHLQTNKVKYIVGKTRLIHSVDSLKLAEEIQRLAEKRDVDVDILVEVNIANEESKFGISKEKVIDLVQAISRLTRVHIKGLMTIAPLVNNPEDNRLFFRGIKELSVDIELQNIDNVSMDILSMGMSGDYEQAILSGANMVRIGSALFGARNYR